MGVGVLTRSHSDIVAIILFQTSTCEEVCFGLIFFQNGCVSSTGSLHQHLHVASQMVILLSKACCCYYMVVDDFIVYHRSVVAGIGPSGIEYEIISIIRIPWCHFEIIKITVQPQKSSGSCCEWVINQNTRAPLCVGFGGHWHLTQ